MTSPSRVETSSQRGSTPRVTRGEHSFRIAEISCILREISKRNVTIHVNNLGAGQPAVDASSGVGVLLTLGHDDALIAIGAEPRLAATLLCRLLDRPTPVVASHASHIDSLAGAFAAIVAHIARRAGVRSPVRVRDAGQWATLSSQWLATNNVGAYANVTVIIDNESFCATVAAAGSAHHDLVEVRSEPAGDRHASPIRVAVTASVSISPRATIASIATGDVWIPGEWPLRRDAFHRWHGTVILVTETHPQGLQATLHADGSLRVKGGVGVWNSQSVATTHSDPRDECPYVFAGSIDEDVAVVRVEIGAASLTTSQWDGLRAGDSVPIDKPLGDHVYLRADGLHLARGVLVDIEGEVGIRILQRCS